MRGNVFDVSDNFQNLLSIPFIFRDIEEWEINKSIFSGKKCVILIILYCCIISISHLFKAIQGLLLDMEVKDEQVNYGIFTKENPLIISDEAHRIVLSIHPELEGRMKKVIEDGIVIVE